MKLFEKGMSFILAVALCCSLAAGAGASTFTDAHGNVIELDDSLEAYTASVLHGADGLPARGRPIWATCGRMRCAGLPFPGKSMNSSGRTMLPRASRRSPWTRTISSRSGTAAT